MEKKALYNKYLQEKEKEKIKDSNDNLNLKENTSELTNTNQTLASEVNKNYLSIYQLIDQPQIEINDSELDSEKKEENLIINQNMVNQSISTLSELDYNEKCEKIVNFLDKNYEKNKENKLDLININTNDNHDNNIKINNDIDPNISNSNKVIENLKVEKKDIEAEKKRIKQEKLNKIYSKLGCSMNNENEKENKENTSSLSKPFNRRGTCTDLEVCRNVNFKRLQSLMMNNFMGIKEEEVEEKDNKNDESRSSESSKNSEGEKEKEYNTTDKIEVDSLLKEYRSEGNGDNQHFIQLNNNNNRTKKKTLKRNFTLAL